MNQDEQTVRDLIARWHRATAVGDVETVLSFIAEDAIFLVAGQPPMRGRNEFEKSLRNLLVTHRIESSGEIQEIEVSGALAYSWTKLTMRIVPLAGGDAVLRAGNAMSILRKQADGSWVLIRDANMLSAAA